MLDGKTVLITGSATGIGAAAARLAHTYSAKVILHGRTETDEIKALAKELKAKFIVADVADKIAVLRAVQSLKEEKIDALINCAGITEPKPFMETEDADWLKTFQVDLLGVVHCCQAVIPLMQKHRYGRIVNIASIRAHASMATARGMAYSVAKAGVVNLTAALAKEFAPDIAVNAVSPGFTETDMAKTWNVNVLKQIKSSLMGRPADPKEIAEAILFLASDRARFITGQTLIVDGGYAISGK
ncbi:MAG: SDR family NAD(P)-dependent oxidoreductase [Patescibacteria group bacterium]